MDLPPELRELIYCQCISVAKLPCTATSSQAILQQPGIMNACRSTRSEFLPLWLRHSHRTLLLWKQHPQTLENFLAAMDPLRIAFLTFLDIVVRVDSVWYCFRCSTQSRDFVLEEHPGYVYPEEAPSNEKGGMTVHYFGGRHVRDKSQLRGSDLGSRLRSLLANYPSDGIDTATLLEFSQGFDSILSAFPNGKDYKRSRSWKERVTSFWISLRRR